MIYRGQPNVVPRLPELHQVVSQRWVKKGGTLVGTLQIFRENGSVSTLEKVVFELPKLALEQYSHDQPVTVFTLVLYTESRYGWALGTKDGKFHCAKSAKIVSRGTK